jgi:predicted nucleic acid-binding protein
MLRELIEADQVGMIGLIRQEVLSGIREAKDFERVKQSLRAFPDEPIAPEIHELAASLFNTCRAKGIQGSYTDFLICGCAITWKMKIFSRDGDYRQYQQAIPIELLDLA